jgi:hypothetical protein
MFGFVTHSRPEKHYITAVMATLLTQFPNIQEETTSYFKLLHHNDQRIIDLTGSS